MAIARTGNNVSTFVKVIDCGIVLNVNLKNFSGAVQQSAAALKWLATSGNDITTFEIEEKHQRYQFYPVRHCECH